MHGDSLDGVHTFTVISANLSWSANTSAVIKKGQQCLRLLRVVRKNSIYEKLLYASTIKSILTYCIPIWFSYCAETDRETS